MGSSRDAKAAAGMEATVDVAAASSVPSCGHHPGVSSYCGRSVDHDSSLPTLSFQFFSMWVLCADVDRWP